ncbi:dienelactone hydrolase family protein [Rhizobium halophytocola]|uniref:Carboxymethylenebutenolidase n=1 Tax=Rhizobium halophytocola TaxID=735519 RepID=A0ABS4E6F7_9HYPH|nr:dienelactone hydrolase family protein [Rhizobium halophytocola]MBP1853524.1 carboxymethylenebutenolidase [Rhizobium halophytocola]
MSVQDLSLTTADGVCPAKLFAPDSAGGAPGKGIILYMDIFGPRQALSDMAERFVGEGYTVLVPDLFYRAGAYGPFDPRTAFQDPDSKAKMMEMKSGTTQAMTMADTATFIAALDEAGCGSKLGTVGYCMGGSRALNAAVAYPDRIGAAASFHGGDLASEAEDSPHRGAEQIKAKVYVGTANADKSFPPEQAARFASTFIEEGCDFTLESYPGMNHGWCVKDHSVYDEKGSERHWSRVLGLFGEYL